MRSSSLLISRERMLVFHIPCQFLSVGSYRIPVFLRSTGSQRSTGACLAMAFTKIRRIERIDRFTSFLQQEGLTCQQIASKEKG
jgi:hypothetical protein